MEREVVITGIGMVTPLGLSGPETWEAAKRGQSGVGPLTRFDPEKLKDVPPNFPRIAAEVKGFDLSNWGVGKKEVMRLDRASQFALAAAIEAMRDARLNNPHGQESFDWGASIGCCMGGMETLEEQFRKMGERGPSRVSPLFIPKMIANAPSGEVSIRFGLRGPNLANSTACATGAHAIGLALEMIRSGKAVIMLAGGTEASITALALSGLLAAGVTSKRNDQPEKASRPFDRDRDGLVIGEGAAVLVLEKLTHALRRDAEIYCELAGAGFNGDAHHMTNPDADSQLRCMILALQDAGMTPEEIDYLNPHATATRVGDISEAGAIRHLFGSSRLIRHLFGSGRREHLPFVSASKSMLGHLLGAAGAVEAALTVLTIEKGVIPPTINLDHPGPGCNLNHVCNQAREEPVRAALKTAFGFGGTNAALVFERFK